MKIEQDGEGRNAYEEIEIGIFDEECFIISQADQDIFLTGRQLNDLAKAIYEGNLGYV